MMPQEAPASRPFIPGLELAEQLYLQGVAPLMARHFPALPYSAALLGPGSDVAGFDTPQSMDHDWGPRLLLFVSESDFAAEHDALDAVLRRELPTAICGYATRYRRHDDKTVYMAPPGSSEGEHRVVIGTVRAYFAQFLQFDATAEIGDIAGFGVVDWLSVPEQYLRMLTAGRVFYDGLGALEPLRARLRYYPHDVWLYVMAAQWQRLSQEEAFMGRCGQAGDELGSRVVAARLVRDLLRLCFIQERQYAPYSKWLGTAFSQLACAATLTPSLTAALQADTWQARQTHLAAAYEQVARQHNALGLTAPLPDTASPFHGRPFLIIHGDRFAAAIRTQISDPAVLALPPHLGNYDQIVDSTDASDYLGRIRGVWG